MSTDDSSSKRCTQCGELKPFAEFNKHNMGRYGLRAACKPCQRKSGREYIAANKERVAAYHREYYKLNKERILERCRQYREANREKYLAFTRNRRARIREVEGEHTFDEIWQMLEDQEGLCAYCETPLFGAFEVDHMVPISRGGKNDWTNLAIACEPCNLTKNAKTAEEFIELLQKGSICHVQDVPSQGISSRTTATWHSSPKRSWVNERS